MIFARVLGALFALLFTFAVTAKQPAAGAPAFMQALFPPELVMQHQRAIGLTEAQRKRITELIQKTQSEVVQLQWDMTDAAQALKEQVHAERIDEERALAAAERLMQIESRIKHTHLGLLIRIKNTLTPEQQVQLLALRSKMNHKPPAPLR